MIGNHIALSIWLVLVIVLGLPSSSYACSCFPRPLERVVVPADGATGFPTDGIIRVLLTAFAPSIRRGLASEYRLRHASGALVPLAASVVGTRLDLDPRLPLRPNANYVLEQVRIGRAA